MGEEEGKKREEKSPPLPVSQACVRDSKGESRRRERDRGKRGREGREERKIEKRRGRHFLLPLLVTEFLW